MQFCESLEYVFSSVSVVKLPLSAKAREKVDF